MYSYHVVKLSSLDLNLLRVLSAVFEEKSVVGASRRLHLTSPAISNALSRLRTALGDPLFVRQGRGLVPTPRALELGPKVSSMLHALEESLQSDAFDPHTTTRTFRVALADNDQIARLPTLAAAFLRALPKARLDALSIDALLAGGGLALDVADFYIGPKGDEPELYATPLYAEDAVLLARQGHPALPAKKKLTPALFARLRHVDTHIALGRPGVGHGEATDAFARAGLVRHVALAVPTFAAAAMIAARTELVACVPRSVARALEAPFALRTFELPGPPFRMPLFLVWHVRTHRDPGARFVRAVVVQSLAERPARAMRTPP